MVAALSLGLIAPLGAQTSEPISFSAGTFDDDTLWTSTGSSSVADGVGKIGPFLLIGNGTLKTASGHNFQANSLYEISLDITHDPGLLSLNPQLQVRVLDGNDSEIAVYSEESLLSLLGLDLLTSIDGLLTDLNLLDGLVTDDFLLVGNLRDLLASLLDGDGDLLNPSLFQEIQELIDSLVGQDPSVLSKVTDLLEAALGNNILDPGSGLPLDLDELLNGGDPLAIISDILDLDPVGDLDLLNPVLALLIFVADDERGPVEELVDVLYVLLGGEPTELDLLSGLLETLFQEQDLLSGVLNILNLELIQGDLLGNLTQLEILSLLGLRDGSESGPQNVKLLFSTGATPPGGPLKIELFGSSTLDLLSGPFTFDNITITRYNLVAPIIINPPGPPVPPTKAVTIRPTIQPDRPRVIRRIKTPRVVIRGKAIAYGDGNAIQKVFSKVKGKGTTRADRKFKKVRGTTRWTARVRVPVSPRTRVIFYALDKRGLKSRQQHVRVMRQP